MMKTQRSALVLASWLFAHTASAAPITQGHLLVVLADELYELELDGTLVQKLAIPGNADEPARDLVFDASRLIQIYHGTSQPVLSTYDTDEDDWLHNPFNGWSTDGSSASGGVAVFRRNIFVTDMVTAGAGSARGLVRFDGDHGYAAERFSHGFDYIDVNLGLDFRLHALQSDQKTVDSFDPRTLAQLSSTTLAETVRGIAVNGSGEIFAASWSGTIHRFSAAGELLQSLASGLQMLIDIDLAKDGRIAVGSRLGKVLLTSQALNAPAVLDLPTSGEVFVAFAETPGDPLVFADGFENGFLTLWTAIVDE